MAAVTAIRTLAARSTHEGDKIKGSRFIADLAPAGSESAALQVLADVRGREPSATHHCWAFRLSDGRERSSDDGEPAGTAGDPILRHLGGADLVDVVGVVTRYYGGTKLGTGGLIRAYGGAVAEALAGAVVVVRPVLATFAVDLPYDLSGAVEGVLAAHDAVTVDATYGEAVGLVITVPEEAGARFAGAMAEATSGRVRPRRLADPDGR